MLFRSQVHGYLNGSELRPTQAQLGAGVRGQVLVRFRGHTLGIAVLHPSGTLEGFFPRRWAGCGAVGSAGQQHLPEAGM